MSIEQMADAIDRREAARREEPQPVPAATMVIVTNRNGFVIRDRFDGVPFTFKPNEPVTIPPDVASHFFGWPAERDVRNVHIAKRRGWNTREYMQRADPMDPLSDLLYERYADNIRITQKEYVLVAREDMRPADDAADNEVLTGDDDNDLATRQTTAISSTHGGRRTGSKATGRRSGRRTAPVEVPTDPPIPFVAIREE
jgi:hypothetical protein